MSAHALRSRTRPLFSLIRCNLLGLIAIAFVVAPSSYALAAAGSSEAKTTRICVVKKTGVLRYVASPGHCRAGERSFFVSRRGVQGLRGVRGDVGARGPAGAVGAEGTTGATGVTGVAGAAGIDGSNGVNGDAGADGTDGTNAGPGADGVDGAPGIDGTDGTNGAAGVDGIDGIDGTNGDPGTDGADGTNGAAGLDGTNGDPGVDGTDGTNGDPGVDGTDGTNGDPGTDGTNGDPGADGTDGAQGPQGDPGTDGAQGAPGPAGFFEYAEFYARMPGDNAATVAIGADMVFPQNGPSQGSIVRASPTAFTLASIGTYRVSFGASISEAGQLQLTLNNVGVAYGVFGRATGTGLITGEAFITTTTVNSVITVRNTSSASALTVTPLAGGTEPVTAYLILQQVS